MPVKLKIAALITATGAFLAWTAWLIVDPRLESAPAEVRDWLGFPSYPIAAAVLAVVLCILSCTSRERPAEPETDGLEPLRRMAGRFAHHFNNLLTTVNGYTDLVLNSMDPADPNRGDMEEIRKAGQKAAQLTGGLLAFSGRQVAEPKSVNVNELIRNVAGAIIPMLGPHSALKLDLGEDLDHVLIDPAQFEQVALSLAANAADAMAGEGTLRIATSRDESGTGVLIAFKDTGSGIDASICGRIFEPFFTTHDPAKGVGLGLSAAYGIVRQNGGTIRVHSEKGLGANFTVYLPSGAEGGEWAGAARARTEQSTFKAGAAG